MTQVSFTLRGRNPDVLTCIANLSNDEVFTPPEFANRMLDTLAEAWVASHNGANLWADKTVKFLDSCTKSGVFLREITSRLNKGLADEMPDLEERVNHILTRQVFGIGITHLTSLLARRSVYCSKHANGQHSIAKTFTADVFPGVGLKGGVCYFLWERDNPGLCRVTTRFKDWPVSTTTRRLLEKGADVFIRFNEGLSILKKVASVETGQTKSFPLPESMRFDPYVSSARVFGLRTFFKGNAKKSKGDVLVYQNGGTGYTPRVSITTGTDLIDKWKIFVSYAAPGTGNRDTYPHKIISTPFIGEPGSISSETYLCIGPFDSKSETESVLSYLSCRLTRLLILLHKSSQHTTRKAYTFVPKQDWTKHWTDADLYAKYGLTVSEIDFIEKIVRPMDLASDLLEDVTVVEEDE